MHISNLLEDLEIRDLYMRLLAQSSMLMTGETRYCWQGLYVQLATTHVMTMLVAPCVLTACVIAVTWHVSDIVMDLYTQSMPRPMLQCRYKALYNTKLEY